MRGFLQQICNQSLLNSLNSLSFALTPSSWLEFFPDLLWEMHHFLSALSTSPPHTLGPAEKVLKCTSDQVLPLLKVFQKLPTYWTWGETSFLQQESKDFQAWMVLTCQVLSGSYSLLSSPKAHWGLTHLQSIKLFYTFNALSLLPLGLEYFPALALSMIQGLEKPSVITFAHSTRSHRGTRGGAAPRFCCTN